MRLVHTDPQAAGHVEQGEVYSPDEDGVFEIPDHLAESMLRRPEWSVHDPGGESVNPEKANEVLRRQLAAERTENERLTGELAAASSTRTPAPKTGNGGGNGGSQGGKS